MIKQVICHEHKHANYKDIFLNQHLDSNDCKYYRQRNYPNHSSKKSKLDHKYTEFFLWRNRNSNPAPWASPGSRRGWKALTRAWLEQATQARVRSSGRSRCSREPPAPAGGGSTENDSIRNSVFMQRHLRRFFDQLLHLNPNKPEPNMPRRREGAKEFIKKINLKYDDFIILLVFFAS